MSFLRKSSSQPGKGSAFTAYLTYAIGEIILVVIGILLAVALNNWSETRKDREAEQVLLKSLFKEMTSNQEELVKAMSYHKRSEDATKKLTAIYSGDYHQYPPHTLDSLFAEVQWAWTFDPRLGVLNSIKTTGKLNIIRNPKIQSFVSSFEEEANDSREEALTIKTLILTQFMPLVNQYISANERDKYLGVKINPTKFKSDYEGLFNDRAIESLIGYIYFWRTDERSEEQEVLRQLEESIAVVKEEIEK